MAQKRRKKRTRPAREVEGPPASTATKPARPLPGAAGGRTPFIWGLAAGFLATLALTLASDLGWIPLGEWTQPPAGATPASSSAGTRILILDGVIPPSGVLLADGAPVTTAVQDGRTQVTLPRHAATLELRGRDGALWSAELSGSPGDTLRPGWSAEVVVDGAGAAGATLFVDDHEVGALPAAAEGLAPGWHVISVRDGETVLYEEARDLEPGDLVSLAVPPAPPRGSARLVVRSRRLDAQGVVETKARPVRLDGNPAGETPVELTVEAGFHSIAVGEPGRPAGLAVVHLDGGSTRYVDIESREEAPPELVVGPASPAETGGAWLVSVRVRRAEAPLRTVVLHLDRGRQREPVDIPLIALPNDPELWVGTVPRELTRGSGVRAFASGEDVLGRAGWSEIVELAP